MAIGVDGSLPNPVRSPLRGQQAPASSQQSPPSYGYRPPMISDSAVQGAVNNQLEAGFGVGAATLRGSDRAGISRGKGQRYMADIAQAGADAQGRAAAAQTEMGASSANAAAESAYRNTMQNERLSNEGLLEGLRHAGSMEGIAKQGWQQNLYEQMRRGRFGLDSQQLDWTPLLQSLLR